VYEGDWCIGNFRPFFSQNQLYGWYGRKPEHLHATSVSIP
jgi:hypothetical protein